jgi:nickel-dependent lactate racemase
LGKRNIRLKWGKEIQELEIEVNRLLAILENKKIPPISRPEVEIMKCLDNPIASKPLKYLIKPGEKVVLIISDITRSVRNDVMIPAVVKYLNQNGIPDKDITIITATGTHRCHTKDEFIKMLGRDIVERIKIVDHDCKKSEMVYLGETSRKTPIYINKEVYEADRIILTGGIVYHSMAGFGGGRKSICPGVCGEKTIQQNHKLILKLEKHGGLHEDVGLGKMDRNPMSLDMIEIAEKVLPDFLINVVINDDGEIGRVFAGHYITAHQEGCRFVKNHYSKKLDQKADVVIASCGGFPKDINLYQASKAIENSAAAAKEGGIFILLARCNEGVGNPQFYEILAEHETLKEKEEILREDFTIARGAAYLTARILAEGKRIVLISELEDSLVKKMGFIPAKDLAQAYSTASEMVGEEHTLYIIPHASTLVPAV